LYFYQLDVVRDMGKSMRTGVQSKLAFAGQASILILIYVFMAMGIVFTGYLYYLN
jgi:hypothetical protein